MTKEQCLSCEYEKRCFAPLYWTNQISKNPCTQARNKRGTKVDNARS